MPLTITFDGTDSDSASQELLVVALEAIAEHVQAVIQAGGPEWGVVIDSPQSSGRPIVGLFRGTDEGGVKVRPSWRPEFDHIRSITFHPGG